MQGNENGKGNESNESNESNEWSYLAQIPNFDIMSDSIVLNVQHDKLRQ